MPGLITSDFPKNKKPLEKYQLYSTICIAKKLLQGKLW